MPTRLFVVHGSHPCKTVELALRLKGVDYTTVEMPPPSQVVVQRLLFGVRTVPAIRFDDGEKVAGSRAILARLDERVPSPALLPEDLARRDAVLDAERWGDEVLQPLTRRVLWPTLKEHPGAAPSYSEGGKLKLPGFALRASMPLISRIEMRMNATSPAIREADLAALPGHLDRVDAWIADGTMGGEQPNRADLQIAPSLSLLMTMQDLRALIAPRPCGALADRLVVTNGRLPAGSLPASQLPREPATA